MPQTRPAGVHVRTPATSANLGPGFDSLGLALGLYDEVSVRLTGGAGLTVEAEGEGAGEVPLDDSHLVVQAMRAAFDAAGERLPGLHLRCTNRIPHGRGLGSSAAAIVAGASAATALLSGGPAPERLDRDRVFRLAAEIEGHPDNVAACATAAAAPDRLRTRGAVVHRAGARVAAGIGAARRRRIHGRPRGTARRGRFRPTGTPAGSHRGPVARALPRTGNAGDHPHCS